MLEFPQLSARIGGLFALLTLGGCGELGLEPVSGFDADTGGLSAGVDEPLVTQDVGADDAPQAESEPDAQQEDEEEPASEPAPDAEPEDEAPQTEEPADDCTYDGFPILMHQATQDLSDPQLPLFRYQARDVDTMPFDELQITSFQGAPYYGPSSPGQYSLAGSNYVDCALCVVLITSCNDSYQCDRVHLADEGILEVVDFGDRSGQFRARLYDAVIREVEIDPYTYVSTPVPGGDTWCIDEIDIQVATYTYY